MKTPVCVFDLRSGVLCQQCEEKVRSGEVSNIDLSVMTVLLDEERDHTFLQKCEYVKSADTGHLVMVILKGPEPQEEQLEEVSRLLARKLRKRVKIIFDRQDPARFYQSIVEPARLIAVNTIWLPDGTEEIRIIIDDPKKLRLAPEDIIETVRLLKGVNIRLDFA